MADPRTIRRLAFQTLYQLDAVAAPDLERIGAALQADEGITQGEARRVMQLAEGAFAARAAADAAVAGLAPEWPSHRQPAVDRAILRLAHYEMHSGRTPPKVAVNEAIKLAKEFSTERSPAFINAVLDKLLKAIPDGPAVAAEPLDGGA
jgi:N utilization substance protein B